MPLVNASVLGAIPPVGCLPRIENPVFFRNRSFPGGEGAIAPTSECAKSINVFSRHICRFQSPLCGDDTIGCLHLPDRQNCVATSKFIAGCQRTGSAVEHIVNESERK